MLENVLRQDLNQNDFNNASETLINLYSDYSRHSKVYELASRMINSGTYDKDIVLYSLKKSRSSLQRK